MSLRLVFRAGQPDARAFPLVGTSRIGRGEGNEIIILDASLSRTHATVEPEGAQWFVDDRTSKNGTWLNGVRIAARTLLSDGDELRCGDVVFRVELPTASAPRA